jgi:hypothetical protein
VQQPKFERGLTEYGGDGRFCLSGVPKWPLSAVSSGGTKTSHGSKCICVYRRGHDEIDRGAGAITATCPDFRYQPIIRPEELGNGGRIQWVSGRPGEAPTYAGTDFIIARDGRIAALYLFFDKPR